MVGAAFQIGRHIGKHNTALGIAIVSHKTGNMVGDQFLFHIVHAIFDGFCLRNQVEGVICKDAQAHIYRFQRDNGYLLKFFQRIL